MSDPNLFTCAKCGAEIIACNCGCSTGYAVLPDVGKICYDCSAEVERQFMRDNGHSVLYLTFKEHSGVAQGYGSYEITDWPGRLRIPVAMYREGGYSMFGLRFDCWFLFEGEVWHGVKCGENHDTIHVRRTKYTSLDKVR